MISLPDSNRLASASERKGYALTSDAVMSTIPARNLSASALPRSICIRVFSHSAVMEGDVTNGTVMAGQIAGMVTKEQTCKEMIEEMMEQATKLLGR